jgi:sec-independent protein translocase protein TatC
MIREDKQLPFLAHLDEVRKRFLVFIVCFFALTGLSLYFAEDILHFLKLPAGPQLGPLAVFSPLTAILSFIRIAFFCGFTFSLPVLLYEVWMFILPALEERWEHYGFMFIVSGIGLFMAGVLFSFYLLIPASLKFLLRIGQGELQFIISLDSYISFVLLMLLSCGLIFEIPVLAFFLAKIGILTGEFMVRQWKMAVVGMLIIAAAITPSPDLVNMFLMALPIVILYILSIGIVFMVQKKTAVTKATEKVLT